jgi:LCP family protein required for cell wall assembly
MKKLLELFLSISIIILFVPSIYALQDEQTYNISRHNKVDNILLIGKDSFDSKGPARSDTMIILTLDNLNKSIKLTSIARDTLVNIPNRGNEKLNHAYAYGKEELLLQTINQNFKLDIKDYAVVDFMSFIEIIDTLGGVDVEVYEKEINHLNQIIKSSYCLNEENRDKIKYIDNCGFQNLNGYQALAYARIRKIDTIYKRDERQRKILTNIAYKLSNTPITEYPAMVKNVAKNIDVNISLDKITKLAFLSHELGSYEIKQLQFPLEQYREEDRINGDGMYVVKWKEEENLKVLHEFIYEK